MSNFFERFLEDKSKKVNVRRENEIIAWDEGNEEIIRETKLTHFLDFLYSESTQGNLFYVEKSTALDIIERINWLEENVKKLRNRTKILSLALLLALIFIFVLVILK